MPENLELLSLRTSQQGQILEQYRQSMFTQELRLGLLIKMLEEKGLLAKGELDTRWPHHLENDIGIMGPDGMMKGSLKLSFYDC